MAEQLPQIADGETVLLGYQQRLLDATSKHQVVVCEKSRRIGATWGIGADAVLTAGADRAAGGQDVFYIGYNRDMTREFIDTCAMWAREFLHVAAEVSEFLFIEQGDKGADREIQAFRINFASGFEIVALCSRPRSLRGRQGYVIIDEAAFHDELSELLKAALALLIWGGRVLIISTHDGVDNPFNQLCEEIRAGKKPYNLQRVTFEDALADGLYRRVCLKRGIVWTERGELEWARDIRDQYGDAALEELDCVPRQSGGKYLPRTLLEARAVDSPVVRWQRDAAFVDLSEQERTRQTLEFCETELAPLLAALPADLRHFLGEDFGRTGDLTILWPLTLRANMDRHTPFVVELRNVPFTTQQQIVNYILDRLPRLSGAAFDARGNGQFLAEVTRQRYGSDCVAEVMLSEGWYREHMPPFKAALEDGSLNLPRDSYIIDDFRGLEVVRGVARVGDRTTDNQGKRHGDGAIAGAIAYFASRTLDAGPVRFAAQGGSTSLAAFQGDPGIGREATRTTEAEWQGF
jgi:phage FluMu gp28-like protein